MQKIEKEADLQIELRCDTSFSSTWVEIAKILLEQENIFFANFFSISEIP
jgi:hypothetical protein